MITTDHLIYKLIFLAFFLGFEVDAISDPFTRSCPSLPSFTGQGSYAFEGTITNLLRDASGYQTAEVRVGKIYKGASDLAAFETIRDLQRAYTCGHLHRVGDVRLWVVSRHSSGRLTAKASLANLNVNVREIELRLRDSNPGNSGDGNKNNGNVGNGNEPQSCRIQPCQFGGVCHTDSSGVSRCKCLAACTKEYEPVCGSDDKTYTNPCLLSVARCNTQKYIYRRHYGQCGSTSCAGLKNAGIAKVNGIYSLYPNSSCNMPVQVYCHDMNTAAPKEYISLTTGAEENYAFIYPQRQPRSPLSARNQCNGKPGRLNYTHAGLTKFNRVRLDVNKMRIIRNDFTFAVSDPFGKQIPFGTAGDCFSMHSGPCRRGHFKINLSGTGFRLGTSVQWIARGFPPGIEMQNYEKSIDGTIVSAKCGGWCAHCQPDGDLLVTQSVCKATSKVCALVTCEYYGRCVPTSNGLSHRCDCPSNCPVVNYPVCGTNGKTYDNECHLQKESCEKRITITVTSYGACNVQQPVHLFFAIDARGNDEPTKLQDSKAFLKKLANQFEIPAGGISHSMMYFLPSGRGIFEPYLFKDHSQIPPYINIMESTKGKASLDKALRDSVPGLLKRIYRDYWLYDKYAKVVVLITDGKSINSASTLRDIAEPLESAGIKVVPIVIGDSNAVSKIRNLAPGDEFIIPVGSSDRLDLNLRKTVQTILKDLNSCRFKRCSYYGRCLRRPGQGGTCACENRVDPISSPVCGTDGKTFKNEIALQIYACSTKRNIAVWHKGACVVEPTCEQLNCRYHSYCTRGAVGAVCICPDPSTCGMVKSRVCGTDGITYDNACKLRAESCRRSQTVNVLHSGYCIQQPVDLVFAFGGSDQIDQQTFQLQKDFIKSFLDSYGTSHAGIRLGLINYGTSETLARFNNYDGYAIKRLIDNSVLRRGGTVESGLRQGEYLLTRDRLVRPHALKGLVILTGERISEDGNALRVTSAPLRNKGVKVISIAVGNNPDKSIPMKFTSGDEFILSFAKERDLPSVVPGTYIALTKDPCKKVTCQYYGQCIWYYDGRTKCQCRDRCPQLDDRVCGSDQKDYPNRCTLDASACRKKSSVKLWNNGPCGSCSQPMDVGIMLASSRKAGPLDYQLIKQQLAKLVDYFTISKDTTRFGFIHYNEQPFLDFTFNDASNSDAEKLKRKIFNVPYNAGLPRTDKALTEAAKRLFSAKGGARMNVPKLLVIVSDYNTGSGSTPYSQVLEPLKEQGVTPIVVGIGRSISNDEMYQLSMENNKNVVRLGGYNDLSGKIRDIAHIMCQEGVSKEPVNLAFAINANGRYASDSFSRMTDVVSSIIDSFGRRKINYGLIVYGGSARTRLRFGDSYSTDDKLKSYVRSIQHNQGGSQLASALLEADRLFSGSKPQGSDVLVVMTDSQSSSSSDDVDNAARNLQKKGVRIVTVTMGTDVDPGVYTKLSPHTNNSVVDKPDESPKQLADRVIKHVTKENKVPMVDIVFALSATATASRTNFKQMKAVLTSILDYYGRGRILYSIVVYGRDSQIQVKFSDQFPTDEALKKYIIALVPKTGGSDVLRAFGDGKKLFESEGSRPGAQKVLVVFTDKRSTSNLNAAKDSAKDLRRSNVKIVTVALGNEADNQELGNYATNEDHQLRAKNSENPLGLGIKIMELAFKKLPTIPLLDLGFAISATAVRNADANFNLMKQTVNYIVKAYGIDDVRYTILTYGATPTTVVSFRNTFPTSLALRSVIGNARRNYERPNLHLALDSARRIFQENARPGARKVLVVIADRGSLSNDRDVSDAQKKLNEADIRVIPVSLGVEADKYQLLKTTSNPRYLIEATESERPDVLGERIMGNIVSGPAVVPFKALDIVFGLGADSTDPVTTFQLMKSIIRSFIDAYGLGIIDYSVFTFGSRAQTAIRFQQEFPTPDQIKSVIRSIPRNRGLPALDEAMKHAKGIFDGSDLRKNSMKVLVIMTDKRSGVSAYDIKSAANSLLKQGIFVIPVAIGNEADPNELRGTTSKPSNIIKADKNEDPKPVSKEIMDKITQESKTTKPKAVDVDLAFSISISSRSSQDTFSRMKETIKYIIDNYGTDRIHYSIIMYGARVIDFKAVERFPSISDFKKFIDQVPYRSVGTPLNTALQAGIEAFKSPDARPNARKVLVVIMDHSAGATVDEILTAARPLKTSNVKVIPVAIGNVAEPDKMINSSPDRGNLIKATRNEKPAVLGKQIMDKVLKDQIPKIDLAFALSADTRDADKIFRLIQNTIKSVIDKYGTDDIRYCIITFSQFPFVRLRFGDLLKDVNQLKKMVDNIPREVGVPVLDKALEKGREVFKDPGARSDAKKVLVVIVDRKSRTTERDLRRKAKTLENDEIHVIPVAIGNQADKPELEIITVDRKYLITAPTDEDPDVLAEKIMKIVLTAKSKSCDVDVMFAVSAVSSQSTTTFNLIRNTIKSIIDQYGTQRLHYSLLVFGSRTVSSFTFSNKLPDKDQVKRLVDNAGRQYGDPALNLALKEATKTFNGDGVRQDARKVLVLMMDSRTIVDRNVITSAARPLQISNIQIIGVAIDNEAIASDFQNALVTTPGNSITVARSEKPGKLGDRIMDKIFPGLAQDVDLAFAISSSSREADRIYPLMKDTIHSIIDTCGANRIRYSVIIFGSQASTRLGFADKMPELEELKRLIENLPRRSGAPAIDKAMDEANRLFSGQGVRPNSRKALVIFVDRRSDSTESAIKAAARQLDLDGIRVVPVGIGREVDSNQLLITTPEKDNLVQPYKDDKPDNIGKKILAIVLKDRVKIPKIDLALAITATASDADRTFKLTKDAIKSIIDRYGIGALRYSFIVYSDVASIQNDFQVNYSEDQLKRFIDAIQRMRGGSSLDKALQEGGKVLRGPGSRPDAHKVLVVVTDKKSNVPDVDLRNEARVLEHEGIVVVPVGIGKQIDVGELGTVTKDKDNVLTVDKDNDVTDFGNQIVDKILEALKRVPKMDLLFALSASSAKSSRTYPLMKKAINYIISTYGIDSIHYGVIVYGSLATIHRNFDDQIPDSESLMRLVSALPSDSSGSSIDKALQRAEQVFGGPGVRPDAKKVLVVITDKSSGLSAIEIKAAAKPVVKKYVHIIPVTIGDDVDRDTFGVVSPDYRPITEKEDGDPVKLGKEIMKFAMKDPPKLPAMDLTFAISSAASQSVDTFNRMKQILRYIYDEYGYTTTRFSVIVFADTARTLLRFDENARVYDKKMVALINGLPRYRGRSDLNAALVEANRGFDNSGRPDSKKVLVIITDKASGRSLPDIKRQAQPLADKKVLVIPVSVGKQASVPELEQTTNDKENVIKKPEDLNPAKTGQQIIEKIEKGVKPEVPEIDMAFAISATSSLADQTFRLMKDTIKTIVQTYGTDRIHHSLIIYGATAVTRIPFSSQTSDPDALRTHLDSLPRDSSGALINVALEEAGRVFKGPGVRPNAKKVLVIITDRRSGVRPDDIRFVAKPLSQAGIIVIPVAIGNEVNKVELEPTTSDKSNVLAVPTTETPRSLADKIMEKSMKPSIPELDLAFAITATSSDGEEIYKLMKSTIQSIITKYGDGKIQYGLIHYADVSTTKKTFREKFPSMEKLKLFIGALPRYTGGVAVEKALAQASQLFTDPAVRPKARKVLVMMTDNASGRTTKEIDAAAKPLHDADITIIAVSFGNQVNKPELETFTGDEDKIIPSNKNADPDELRKKIMDKIFQETRKIPKIDLVFAVSATSRDALRTYKLMKDAIKYIAGEYGIDKIHYGLIVFGDLATIRINFSNKYPTSDSLKAFLDTVSRSTGRAALDQALSSARQLFNDPAARPDAKKVLVVITDKSSGLDSVTIKSLAKPLHQSNVRIIAFTVGNEGSRRELENLTPHDDDVKNVPSDEDPEKLGQKIIKLVLTDRAEELDIAFAISTIAVNADETFYRMKETMRQIIDHYGTQRVKYSITIFDELAKRRVRFSDNFSSSALKNYITLIQRKTGTPNLANVLRDAENMFKNAPGVRPNSKKVLVVIVDKRSSNSPSAILFQARPLTQAGVRVIPVAVGKDADRKELEKATNDPSNVIAVPRNEPPKNLAEKIIAKIEQEKLIPEIDLAFALSSTSASSTETYKLMKDTINTIVNEYGIERFHYSIVVFGSTPKTFVQFSQTFPKAQSLKDFVSRLPRRDGGPSLDEALKEGRKLFQNQFVRPHAKKVLVVIMDRASRQNTDVLMEASKPLDQDGIRVISIAVGDEADPDEFSNITPFEGEVITVPKTEKPTNLADKLIAKLLEVSILFSSYMKWLDKRKHFSPDNSRRLMK